MELGEVTLAVTNMPSTTYNFQRQMNNLRMLGVCMKKVSTRFVL